MRIKKNTLIGLLIIISSCGKGFLETPPGNLLTREEYVTNLNTLDDYLNGIYGQLLTTYCGHLLLNYPEMAGDNLKPAIVNPTYNAYYSWGQQADNGATAGVFNMNQYYVLLYNMISASNFVIEKADEYSSENMERANSLKGQALFFRALVHHFLVNIFAQSYSYTADASHPGVIYSRSFRWDVPNSKRLSVAQVYEQLVLDLQESEKLLPPGTKNTVTISKNAASALLSRVYLYKQNYEGAIKSAKEVIQLVPLMTNNYPDKLFTLQETEAIFQVMPSEGSITGNQPGGAFRSPSILYYAGNDIAALLNESTTDKRKAWLSKNGNNWQVFKYPTGVIPELTQPAKSYYQTILRSSELYLNLAEAYANKGVSFEDSAIFYLDAIRKRADNAALPTNLSGDALKEAIYKERRKELAFEGQRLFDIMRWKKSVKRSDPLMPAGMELNYPNDKFIAPIPSIDVKLLGIAQNNGY